VKALFQIMGSVLLACLGVATYILYVNTRPDTEGMAIQRAVAGQLEAIRGGDYDRAYELASTGYQRTVNRRRFEMLVRRNFEPTMESNGFAFGNLMHDDDSGVVNVTVTNAAGRVVLYQYRVGLQKEGWRIQSVTQQPMQQATRPPDRRRTGP
jgi:hypothetical protein